MASSNQSAPQDSVTGSAGALTSKRCDPISEMLRSYKPDEHTKDAIDWLEDDDCNYQEKAAEWFWDAITERVKAEYAFAIFKRRHIYGEAA